MSSMSRMSASSAITVVLVHTDDEPVVEETLATVAHQDRGGAAVSTIVVDAGSERGPRAWAGHSDVQVVAGFAGMGLAAGRNRGAWSATSEYVAFLDVATRPAADWLARSVAELDADPAVTIVSPRFRGRRFPSPDYTGHQVHRAAPRGVAEGAVLCPPSEAMVVRSEAFRALGGFDEELDRFGEDVDLGWRCNLLGHRVLGVDVEISRVRGPAVEPDRRRFLEERNALRNVYRHYEEARLAVALAGAMAMAARAADEAGAGARSAAAAASADLVSALPRLGPARAALQAARLRGDHELTPLFHPLDEPVGPLGDAEQAVTAALGATALFGRRRRVLVLTVDVLAERMAGPAIRVWQIASALSAEHDVHVATTADLCELTSPDFEVSSVDEAALRRLEAWCDVVVVQGFVLRIHPFLQRTRKVVVVDLYDPLHLEQLELARAEDPATRRMTVQGATDVLNEQLERGDYFICASPKQRDFWLGQLSGVGRINPMTYDDDENLESLIGIVPFGLPEALPVHDEPAMRGVIPGIEQGDEIILWGGGIYNWFDPLTLLRAVDRLRLRRPQVRLVFLGLKHPNPLVHEMRMSIEARRLSDELGLTGTHAFFNEGWVPYAERQRYLLEADVGVSTHQDHIETAFSFRTRILDYLWAGLPIVATTGDSFAELIDMEHLGLTVPAADVEALEQALYRMLDDAELAAMCRKNLAVVRPRFVWATVLQPLVEFCRTPRRAPDLVDPHHRSRTDDGFSPEVLARPSTAARSGGRGVREDVAIAARHLREGGVPKLAAKLASRVRHSLAGRS